MTLASGQEDPHLIAVDGASVYWITDGDAANSGKVMQIPLDGGTSRALVDGIGTSHGLAIDATSVYWTDSGGGRGDGKIMKVPLAGGAAVPLADRLDSPFAISVDRTRVYWTDNQSGSVMKVPVAGGPPVVMASGQAHLSGIGVDGTSAYWVANRAVLKAPLAGGAATVLFSAVTRTYSPPSGNLVVDGTGVYWLDAAVMKVPLGGGRPVWLWVGEQGEDALGIAVDTVSVYFTRAEKDSWAPAHPRLLLAEPIGFSVLKVPRESGTSTTLVSVRGNAYSHQLCGMAVDATSLYWVDARDGTVMKLTPK